MSAGSAPIRFLAVVVGGWTMFRLASWMPIWLADGPEAAPIATAATAAGRTDAAVSIPAEPETLRPLPSNPDRWFRNRYSAAETLQGQRAYLWVRPSTRSVVETRTMLATALFSQQARSASGAAGAAPPLLSPRTGRAAPLSLASSALPAQPRNMRWSGSAWLLLRGGPGAGPDLAPGGTLGGSQAGARILYRLNGDARRPLALSGRFYLPVDRPQGAEVALGIDWQPSARLPVHILAERRQRIGDEGRSDFALTVYGGVDRRLLRGRLHLEAYGQTGVVGLERRDLFVDAAARAGVAVGPVEIGGGVWGGAQPGVSRLDAGPQLSTQLPLGRFNLRASAEWRFRVAGDAAPGSGPALTISAGF